MSLTMPLADVPYEDLPEKQVRRRLQRLEESRIALSLGAPLDGLATRTRTIRVHRFCPASLRLDSRIDILKAFKR